MATLSKRIERRDFICSPVISCLSKTTISHRNTVVHGPISWVGGLLVRVTILAWKVTCGGVLPFDWGLGRLTRCLVLVFSLSGCKHFHCFFWPRGCLSILTPIKSALSRVVA